jgi:hypothetical protein
MTVERYIRVIAGTFILTSVALAHWHSHYWLLFTAFVGVNLFQAGLTNWCLMEKILKKIGVGCCSKPDCGEESDTTPGGSCGCGS